MTCYSTSHLLHTDVTEVYVRCWSVIDGLSSTNSALQCGLDFSVLVFLCVHWSVKFRSQHASFKFRGYSAHRNTKYKV